MLYNLFGFIPEIYLLISILSLFTFGVFYEKLSLNLLNNFILFGLISLLFTLNLFFIQIFELNTSLFIFQGFFELNTFSLILKTIATLSTFFVYLLVYKRSFITSYETINLISLALLGLLLIISAKDLLVLYISLELYSLSIYILAGTFKNNKLSTEASLKYLLLGAVSSGFFLFGSALIYAYTGDTHFYTLINFTNEIKIGAVFILIALFFKLAVAPFHMWAPDVYEGSPTFITGFFAIVPKIIIFGVIINLVTGPFYNIFNDIKVILYFVAVTSLIVGSIGGLNQTKIKRLIAYSSISHIGFILTALLPNTLFAIQSINIYLIYYIIMSINLFAIVLTIFGNSNSYITQLSGLSRKNPILAITLSFNLLSMAGIPPLAGFLSKYYVLLSIVWDGYYLLAVLAVIASTISAFYYIRIIKWIYFKDTKDFIYKSLGDICSPIKINFTYSIVIGVSTYLILTLLIYPNPILLLTSLSLNF